MNNFKMLIGLPGSGKSCYAESLSKSYKIHSSDKLREELFGDVDNQENNDLLFKELHKRIKHDLSNSNNVIYDATNISYKRRMAFLNEIKDIECNKKAIFFATPYEVCLERNLQRERKVPEYVIKKMYYNFDVPAYFEGWDKINIFYYSILSPEEYNLNTLFDRLDKIEQDNPHHKLTIGEHCRKCAVNVASHRINKNFGFLISLEEELIVVALLHDIGKEKTKVYNEEKGYSTYYQHHHISAYDSVFYLSYYGRERIIEIITLIRWHMQPFFVENEKTEEKYINLLGEQTWKDIKLLHECDKLAKE